MSKIERFHEEYRFLSNFWYTPVLWAGEMYPTNEHAFQAAKTDRVYQQEEIRTCCSPGKAKLLGRSVTLRNDWEFIKLYVMLELNRQKFKHPELAAQLLATGDAELIEGNTWGDKYWGVCGGEGQNWLGKILMCVRDEIRKGE